MPKSTFIIQSHCLTFTYIKILRYKYFLTSYSLTMQQLVFWILQHSNRGKKKKKAAINAVLSFKSKPTIPTWPAFQQINKPLLLLSEPCMLTSTYIEKLSQFLNNLKSHTGHLCICKFLHSSRNVSPPAILGFFLSLVFNIIQSKTQCLDNYTTETKMINLKSIYTYLLWCLQLFILQSDKQRDISQFSV